KLPTKLETVFPIKRGTVAEPSVTELVLQALLMRPGRASDHWLTVKYSGAVCHPHSLSPMEKRQWRQALDQARLDNVVLVDKSQVLRQLWVKAQPGSSGMIVDLGGQTTEVAVISEGEMVIAQTLPLGSDAITEAIHQAISELYHCQISWQLAE